MACGALAAGSDGAPRRDVGPHARSAAFPPLDPRPTAVDQRPAIAGRLSASNRYTNRCSVAAFSCVFLHADLKSGKGRQVFQQRDLGASQSVELAPISHSLLSSSYLKCRL